MSKSEGKKKQPILNALPPKSKISAVKGVARKSIPSIWTHQFFAFISAVGGSRAATFAFVPILLCPTFQEDGVPKFRKQLSNLILGICSSSVKNTE